MASLGRVSIGQYEILHTLGTGSFGKVKLAVHSLTGHRVAIKLVSRRRVKDQDLGERVRREIRHLQRLQHPHIIKLYEVITTPTDIIMVMEYAGGELFDYISSRSRLNEAEARRFFQQIISALGYCHKEKIVHRDLKPENLLLDDRDNIKIADFGLSNMLTDGEFLKTSCGSPNYAAPEVITGKLYAGPEVDVWSCGVILYVMLCGRLPFDHDHIPTLFRKITEGRYSIPSFVSSSAQDLLKRMLVVDPLQRITIHEIWQHEWFARDLPDYLSLTEGLTRSDSEHTEVDEEVLDELQEKLGISACEMRTALTEPRTNPVKVAYRLSMDKRRSFEDDLLSGSDMTMHGSHPLYKLPSTPLTAQSGWTGTSPDSTKLGQSFAGKSASPPTPSSIQVLSSSLPTPQEDPYQSRASRFPGAHHRHGAARRSGVRPRWHFGIRSQGRPIEVMDEVYRALANIGMQWKCIDPFHLRARFVGAHGLLVKLDLQLYTMDNHLYLLDFCQVQSSSSTHMPPTTTTNKHRRPYDASSSSSSSNDASIAAGPADTAVASLSSLVAPSTTMSTATSMAKDAIGQSPFPFFDVCSRLITELALSS
ncbi:kinase-like domain-containing protein [Syncephalis pseudoplumigaleata]|uniref:non-specific serine/threonine protein kinase n=1 Tax=Syncephalis pseudoplumigaleata TaxID=1712513 RepID=A0A4P9YXM6_9FUNG|nr:kinase-like domain-containing protein [Syncephalis pseudoplumigaleata]|eukprot:RKP24836.1 kinase-like domain-containing protein [Syncephalis pseudoplumigaleata]